METAPGTGVLQFGSSPSNAMIIIDDQEYPVRTPTAIKNVPPGDHHFVIRLEGYKDVAEVVEVVEGKLCCTDINLESTKVEQTCNATPIPQTGITPIPQVKGFNIDIGSLIIGIVVGIIAISIIRELRKEKK